MSETVKSARERLGWTQQDLSIKSGVSVRTISAVERAKKCTPRILNKLLKALGLQ